MQKMLNKTSKKKHDDCLWYAQCFSKFSFTQLGVFMYFKYIFIDTYLTSAAYNKI